MDLTTAKLRWQRFVQTRTGRRLVKAVRWTFVAGIVAFLAYRLVGLGWEQLWTSLPTTPWFYVAFVAIFLTLPTFEGLVYGMLFEQPFRTTLPTMLKKRVLNMEVVGYSGEMYLYLWARRHVDRPDRELLHIVKDYNIVSSVASALVAVGLLLVFVVTGQVPLPEAWLQHNALYVTAGLVGAGVVGALAVRFRRAILLLPGRTLALLFGLHVLRLLLVLGLQVVQWAVVLPDVPFSTWCTFLAVQIVVTKVPLLPSRDLLFMGAGMELARVVQVSTAAVAGMLLVHSILMKVANVLLFTGLSFWDRRRPAGAHLGVEADEAEEPLPEAA